MGIFRAEPAGKVFCEIEGWALDEPPLSAEAKCGLATAAANNPPEAVKNSLRLVRFEDELLSMKDPF